MSFLEVSHPVDIGNEESISGIPTDHKDWAQYENENLFPCCTKCSHELCVKVIEKD